MSNKLLCAVFNLLAFSSFTVLPSAAVASTDVQTLSLRLLTNRLILPTIKPKVYVEQALYNPFFATLDDEEDGQKREYPLRILLEAFRKKLKI